MHLFILNIEIIEFRASAELNDEIIKELEEMNNKYQEDYHLNRSKRGKHYGQNPNVYQYYQNLTYDKINKEREL